MVALVRGRRWPLFGRTRTEVGEELRRPTFFLKFTALFAVLAVLLTLGAGYGVSTFVAAGIRSTALQEMELDVSELAAPQIAAVLSPDQLQSPLSGDEMAALDAFVRERLLGAGIVGLNLWGPQGTIVYSSLPELVGVQAPADPQVQRALAGEAVSEVRAVPEGASALAGYGSLAAVYVPLTLGDPPRPAGVLQVYEDYGPIAAHIQAATRAVFLAIGAAMAFLYLALLVVVRRVSIAVQRHQEAMHGHSEEMRNSYESIVAVLCAALDLRDNVTHGHAKRVSEIAAVVAWQMGLRKEQVRQIEKAAILHDIGKIGIADAVLAKPGPLTHEEWAEMKRHPELGYRILREIDFLKDVAEIVYAHHERWDGKGYPRGLKEEEIPLGARIFAVVDAYDAMTSHRPYRRAMPHHNAVKEIVRNSGTQFDPQVVKAFLEAEKRGLIQKGDYEASPEEPVRPPAGAEV